MSLYELYTDIDKHLIQDNKPSDYLNLIYDNPLFKQYPFDMLYKLKDADQSPKYHPEGNVWNHTLLVVDEAAKVKAKSKNPAVFMWAALLHDIGKPSTTRIKKDKITSYDHDKVGAKLSEDFLSKFNDDANFINKVSELIRYHMQILHVVNNLPFADMKGMKKNTDINEVALLGLCDRLGRTDADREKEEDNIKIFLQICNKK
jgi:putative nucleotidyltransferase with HDIG domain